ncbi:MAG: N-acetylneuraminate synthase [Arcobacter sp.]|nr:MAG: N-acetylneuraminate synthase [Arcobacter sp.]
MNNIAIIGAGGHTRSSLPLLKSNVTNTNFKIYDESYQNNNEIILEVCLYGKIEDVPLDNPVFLSIGDNLQREILFKRFRQQLIEKNMFHKHSLIENSVEFGVCNQVYANVFINSSVVIEDNNIINTAVVIEHEVKIGSHNHISIGSVLCGRVVIGNRCFIGASSTIIDKVEICDNVTIGAGSVVLKNITEAGTYVGSPARKIK